MELGIYTFGDIVADPHTGKKPTSIERTRQLMDMARLADDAGLDIIGVGEHHGLGFVNSATAVAFQHVNGSGKPSRSGRYLD